MDENCEFDDTQVLEAIERLLYVIGSLDSKIDDLATEVQRIKRTVESLRSR